MRSGRTLAALVVAALLLAACSDSDDGENRAGAPGAATPSDRKLSVVTTVAPITSIVASVAGDLATVTGIVPEGTNSHTFEPPPSAAKVLSQADVVFVNGLKLEEPIRELAAETARKGADIVALGDLTISPDEYMYDFSFPVDGGKPNPHLWTNPPLAKEFALVAAETLAARDPDHTDAYKANYGRFAAKVDELDQAMVAATATLPRDRRKLLTYHDAYAYFARQYDWTVVGAIQVSNFSEPTPREVADLITQVRREGVPAVFGSEVFPSPVLAQIGKEAGVRYVDVLRDDDLPGEPGSPEHSWLGLMRFDFVTMVEALGGDATALRALTVQDTVPDGAEYPQ